MLLAGAGIGGLLGQRIPTRARDVTTDGLGMVVLLIAALSAGAVVDRSLSDAVGDNSPILIVLGSVFIGGLLGSLVGIDQRLQSLGAWIQRRMSRTRSGDDQKTEGGERPRFIDGFVSASLVMAIGPFAILGALTDGFGKGISLLAIKSIVDFFIALAFAAAFGWGVAAAALSVFGVQGTFTLIGFALGEILPSAHVAALTATGGVLLGGVAIRLLKLREFPTGDLLPALMVAPLLTQVVIMILE
jgi:uncharacterized membrane protein YqgA involved in biofilm formation